MLLLQSADFFHKTFKKILSETLTDQDQDQDQHSVSPVLSLNCLHRLSADDKN